MGKDFSESMLASTKYFLNLNDQFSSDALLSWIGSGEALIGMIFFAVLTTIMIARFIEKT